MNLGRCVFFASNPMFMLLAEPSRISTGKVTKLKQIRTSKACYEASLVLIRTSKAC